ncbi:MAG: holo-ACP synthase [Pseudomonadota bacterium]
MIFGVGTDLVQVSRVQKVYERFGKRFAERLLLPEEMALFERNKRPVRFLAMRFAAREATVKAMGTGFANGMWIRDVGFLPDKWGKPELIWSERGARMCEQLGIGEGFVSLTDEAGMVAAIAVLMCRA